MELGANMPPVTGATCYSSYRLTRSNSVLSDGFVCAITGNRAGLQGMRRTTHSSLQLALPWHVTIACNC